jgi:hypothetical protein
MVYRRGNKLVIGSTQSGKSYAELHDVTASAADRSTAMVVLDPHTRSLAWNSLVHLVSRGHQNRIVWDELDELMRTPKYQFLKASRASHPLVRAKENHQAAEEFSELLSRRRDVASLAPSPQTEEWTIKAVLFLLNQPADYPASHLRYVFRPGHPLFNHFLRGCQDPDLSHEFERISCGAIKPSQYAAAQRLINAVCDTPAFIARCGMAFRFDRFLENRGILLVQGGAISQPVLQTILGSIILQTIHYVRARPYPYPRVLLILDEATNANLVGAAGHEVRALAECQKMGLDIHVLVQSLNFPSAYVTDGVLTNCTRHEWFYAANAAVARKAAEDLGNVDYEPQIRALGVGERYVKDRARVEFQAVPAIKQPWVFPQLAARKVRKAIEIIRKRPEYGGPDECQPGVTVTTTLSDSLPDTSAVPSISSDSSPARRRRTGGSRSSGRRGS